MKELTGTLKTTIIANDDSSHVYEIIREFDTPGDEAIVVTLFPTVNETNKCDLTGLHLLNHCADEGLKLSKIHCVFLFSKVMGTRISTRSLKYDEDNLQYIHSLIGRLPEAKIIISFGSSMDKNGVVLLSKVELFKIIKELRGDTPIWQIAADGMTEEAPHILFAGIRYGEKDWYLSHYVVPMRFSPEGYQLYLVGKEEARERFVKNVLGRKTEKGVAEKAEPRTVESKKNGRKEKKVLSEQQKEEKNEQTA